MGRKQNTYNTRAWTPHNPVPYPDPWCWQWCLLDWPSLYRPHSIQVWHTNASLFSPPFFPHFPQGVVGQLSPQWLIHAQLIWIFPTSVAHLHHLPLQDVKVRSWLGQPDTFPCSLGFVPWHLISAWAQSSAKAHLGPGPCPPLAQPPTLVISTIMMVVENKTPGRERQSKWFPQLPPRSTSMT